MDMFCWYCISVAAAVINTPYEVTSSRSLNWCGLSCAGVRGVCSRRARRDGAGGAAAASACCWQSRERARRDETAAPDATARERDADGRGIRCWASSITQIYGE